MTVKVRRVVTGHDQQGRAIVVADGIAQQVSSARPGHSSADIWATDSFPADNSDPRDMALPPRKSAADGSTFRVVEYAPGVSARPHSTQTVDYAVVISGEIVMQMDDSEVTLRAGDVLVQRGTVHNWLNRGNQPCVIAFILIGAKPIDVRG